MNSGVSTNQAADSGKEPVSLALPGRLPYSQALDFMRQTAQEVREGGQGSLIICEHQPVLTLGRNGDAGNILASRGDLARMGVEVHQVERGGQVTYHGPGQVMAYPVLRLRNLGKGVKDLVWGIEQAIICALGECDVQAGRKQGYPGVWVGQAKIASIGLAIKGGVTLHGLALNNDPDLGHFNLINPCGLTGVRMTSIAKLKGKAEDAPYIQRLLAEHLAMELGLAYTNLPPGWA